MGNPSQDPFYLVKDDIQTSLSKAQEKFARWQSLSKGSSDRKRLEPEIEDECKSIAWQVDEMDKAVDVAEKRMHQFGLTPQEIRNRRNWVHATRRTVDTMQGSVEAAQQIASKVAQPSTASGRLGAAVQQDNDRFLGSEQERQQMVMRRQDEDLDQLGDQVQRIGHMGLQINEELTSQNDLIEQLDEDVEGTSSRLAAAQKKMNSVLKKAGLKGQIMIIVFLLVLLIILILIAFS